MGFLAPKRELDSADLRPGYDAMASLRPWAPGWANVANATLLVALWASGLTHKDPSVWYSAAAEACFALVVIQFGTALPFQLFASKAGRLIQTSPTAQPEYLREEIVQTLVGFVGVVGPILAWTIATARVGDPIALTWDLDEALADVSPHLPAALRSSSYAGKVLTYVVAKLVPAILIADAYNYWKHRLFHTAPLWPFHKYHHSHRNPSALGGYAVSPVFAFATFSPVLAYAVPGLGLWTPAMLGFVGFYLFINHYIHCGYVVDAIENVLAPCYFMTSAWHNTHHNRGRVGFYENDQTFAEMLSLWDCLMGTYPQGHSAKAVADAWGGRKKSVSRKAD
eukprot:TRINITY_DN5838_c0_g1_i1.p1 TRINITY_DN5838_c0_g1~~TRINITY_DN5838_c0_g1_i1.p1  ORF type:complete len:355 (+),score=108.38 TRINITY_DN5838_c0_g1_i1:54-1067(+)